MPRVGSEDPVAPPRFTEALARAARGHGLDAEVATLPGRGHDILLDPDVLAALREMLAAR